MCEFDSIPFINNHIYDIYICIVGSCNTGKSSFVNFINNNFIYNTYVSTIGVEFTIMYYVFNHKNINYNFKIWHSKCLRTTP